MKQINTNVHKVPTNNLIKIMYQVEALIKAEKEPIDEFLIKFKKLKKTYNESIKVNK